MLLLIWLQITPLHITKTPVTFKGLRVLQRQNVIIQQGELRLEQNASFIEREIPNPTPKSILNINQELVHHIPCESGHPIQLDASSAWWPEPSGLRKITTGLWLTDPNTAWFVAHDDQEILLLEPRQLENQARVFLPNPITATGDHSLSDKNNQADAIPESAYTEVIIVREGQKLNNQVAFEVELSAPIHDLVESNNLVFSRDQPEFEAVHAFFHINRAHAYLTALGLDFSNIRTGFDAHALNGADQSQFSTWQIPEGSLEFGDGGVDDAEDGEVIIHEYAHALHHHVAGDKIFQSSQNLALPAEKRTNENRAIGEGIADYWVFTLTEYLNEDTNPHLIMEWDAAGLYPEPDSELHYLRRTDLDLHYPQDLTGNAHLDSQIISRALVDLRSMTSAPYVDRMLWSALAILPNQALFSDLREAMERIDTVFDEGEHLDQIGAAFSARGIYSSYNLDVPLAGDEGAEITIGIVNPHDEKVHVRLRQNGSTTNVTLEAHQKYTLLMERAGLTAHYQKASAFEPRMDKSHSQSNNTQPTTSSQTRRVEPHLNMRHPDFRDPLLGLQISSSLPIVAYQQTSDGETLTLHSIQPVAKQIDLPHVAQDTTAWHTQVLLSQTSSTQQTINFHYENQVIQSWDAMDQQQFFTHLDLPAPWSAIQSEFGYVSGVEWFSRADDLKQSAALTLIDNRSTNLWFPHIAADRQTFWTGLAIVNPGQDQTLQFTLRDSQGNTLDQLERPFKAYEKWVGLAESLFNPLPLEAATLEVQAQEPIFGYELFGTQNGLSTAGIPSVNNPQTELILPHIEMDNASFTGIVFLNPNATNSQITIGFYDSAGLLLNQNQQELSPFSKFSAVAGAFSSLILPVTGWAHVQSDQPIFAFTLHGDLIQRNTLAGLESLPFPNPQIMKEQP